ncbi:MAG: hypothetical protein KC766_11220, partial [Myxococcales bacterium]|nr:hypothetical protein [Myxococcales bacterium]
MRLGGFIGACALCVGCSQCQGETPSERHGTTQPVLMVAAQESARCPKIAAGQRRGKVGNPKLIEASGLVASRTQPPVLWIHNDSGNQPVLYALRPDGESLASYHLSGCQCVDWEDIAIGPGPRAGTDYLYIADSGTNGEPREVITVYRVAEPKVPLNHNEDATLDGVEAIQLSYPGHLVHDAETLFIDPVDGDLYIVTKSALGDSGVYRARAPLDTHLTEQLELVKLLQFPDTGARGAPRSTAGDIAADGSAILLKTYTQAFWFPREKGESIADTLSK